MVGRAQKSIESRSACPTSSTPLFDREKTTHVGAILHKGRRGNANAASIDVRNNTKEKV